MASMVKEKEVKMNMEIYFCVDQGAFYKVTDYVHTIGANGLNCYRGEYFAETENAIEEGYKYIVTSSLAHLSFDLINLGYDIYLCYGDKRIKIEPHMDLQGTGEPCKDLRFGHNIFNMFRAGVFNELLGVKEGGEE